jgi:hypothetical protein
MSEVKLVSREEVLAEMEASPFYEKAVAGDSVMGYLGDLGHVYAHKEQLTKEALFAMTDPEPLIQSPEQKRRARSYELQMAAEHAVSEAFSRSKIGALAKRFVGMFSSSDENPKKRSMIKP